MSDFIDGPAGGVSVMIRRAPMMLRVVRNPQAKKAADRWDALDQVNDKPAPNEEIFVYRRTADPVTSMFLNTGGRGGGGMYCIAKYRYFATQPGDALLRDNVRWQAWATERLEDEKFERAGQLALFDNRVSPMSQNR